MDSDDAHIAGDFFLHSMTNETTRRKTFIEHCQRFIPAQTIIYIQYCLLRIPFILLYDYLFTENFSSIIEYLFNKFIHFIHQNDIQYTVFQHSIIHLAIQFNINLTIPFLGLILLILLLLTTDKRLVIFYSYTISFIVIYFDYQMNLMSDNPNTSSINIYILQFVLSSIYIQMLNIRPRVRSYQIQIRLCHCAPFILLLTRYLNSSIYSLYLLKFYYLIWILGHLSEVFICHRYNLFDIFGVDSIEELYHLYQNLGIQTLLNYIQARIHIGRLLKIFWLTKIIVLPLGFRVIHTNPYLTNLTIGNQTTDEYNQTIIKTMYFTTLFYGTETMFTLISLACLISHLMKFISHRLFRLLHLWTEDVEQIGTVVGVMFFLLLFQSNIIHTNLHRRHIPLLKAFSLLIVALFHFIHTILEPQLLKVAMQKMTTRMVFNQNDDNQQEDNQQTNENNISSKILQSYRHRHVYTCLSILCLVIIYIIILWYITPVSTWLLAVTAFSFELIVRLISSFAQFTVYVFDAHNRLKTSDSFDEYLFRIKAITACLEFFLGVFLLFNGFYILCFESRGALRALMLAIHAHLNIVKNLKRGWQIFRNRKSAWDNVNQLPIANDKQIEDYNDICSICHNTLTSGVACITPCSHIFHQKCLQKAFYATQNCALCSRPIIFNETRHRE